MEDEASPCRSVVSGLSWGILVSSLKVHELDSEDTAGEASDTWSVLTNPFRSPWLRPASVVAAPRVEARGSVFRLRASGELLLVSVKLWVSSVSVGRGKKTLLSLSY